MKNQRLLSIFLSVILLFFTLSPTALCADSGGLDTDAGQISVEEQTSEDTTSESEDTMDSDTDDAAEESDSTGSDDSEDIETTFTIDAKAAVLLELNSNTVVYSKNADEKLFPASLTKVMTCLVALEHGNLTDEVTVSATALDGLDEDGSNSALIEGEVLTLEELLYCMMLASANDSCNVIAEHIAGSIDNFVTMMNEKAEELGCKNTHFCNPHGLHDESHYTTANDMVLITRAALENEMFCTLTSATTHTVPATNKSGSRNLSTTNYLVSTAITNKYYYAKATGIKTGYTTPAGRCLISTASNGSLKYLSVVMGAPTTYDDYGEAIYGNFVETAKLFDYGFDNFAYTQVLSDLAPVGQVPVTMGASTNSVVIIPSESLTALLPKNFDESLLTTSYELSAGSTLEAPLEVGETVGTITVFYDGTYIGETTIETVTSVERNGISYVTRNYGGQIILVVIIVLLLLLLVFVILRQIRLNKQRKQRPRHRIR